MDYSLSYYNRELWRWRVPFWYAALLNNPDYHRFYYSSKVDLYQITSQQCYEDLKSDMVRKSGTSRLSSKRPISAVVGPSLPSGQPALTYEGSGSSNSDGITHQHNHIVNGVISGPGKNVVGKPGNAAIIDRCPQCGILFNTSKYRKVTESCGHAKCRNCVIMSEDGCALCSTGDSSPTGEADDGNFGPYSPNQNNRNGPTNGDGTGPPGSGGVQHLTRRATGAHRLQSATNSRANSVNSGRPTSSSPSSSASNDTGRQSSSVYSDSADSDSCLRFPTSIAGGVESDGYAATIDFETMAELTAPNLAETGYMSISDYPSTDSKSYTSIINEDSEFSKSLMSLRKLHEPSIQNSNSPGTSGISLGTTSHGGLVTRAQLKELTHVTPVPAGQSSSMSSSSPTSNRTSSSSGSSSLSKRQCRDSSQAETDHDIVNSKIASGGGSPDITHVPREPPKPFTSSSRLSSPSAKGNSSGATEEKSGGSSSSTPTTSRLSALLTRSSSKNSKQNVSDLPADPLSNTSTTSSPAEEPVVHSNSIAKTSSDREKTPPDCDFNDVVKDEEYFPEMGSGDESKDGDDDDDDDIKLEDGEAGVGSVPKKKKKRSPVIIHDHITVLGGEPTMYQCNVCQKKFKTKAHIKYHEFCQKGDKPFKCKQCGQGFIAKSHYEYHLRTHTGERPYVCPKCGKGFNQRGKVTRHMRSHTGEKPFVCQECNRGFANAQALRSHTLIHTGERPFACTYCNKRFTGMTNLKKHVITHTGERPFSCNHCGKSFGLKWTLDLHLRTHSSERPYACDQCSRAFSNSKDLRRHLVIHSGERPFKCWICGTAFRRKDNLDRHIKNTHNQPKEVAKKLANEAAAEYLKQTTNNQSLGNIPVSKVNSVVISNIIKNADLMPPGGIVPNNIPNRSILLGGPGSQQNLSMPRTAMKNSPSTSCTSSSTATTTQSKQPSPSPRRRVILTPPLSPPTTRASRSKETESSKIQLRNSVVLKSPAIKKGKPAKQSDPVKGKRASLQSPSLITPKKENLTTSKKGKRVTPPVVVETLTKAEEPDKRKKSKKKKGKKSKNKKQERLPTPPSPPITVECVSTRKRSSRRKSNNVDTSEANVNLKKDTDEATKNPLTFRLCDDQDTVRPLVRKRSSTRKSNEQDTSKGDLVKKTTSPEAGELNRPRAFNFCDDLERRPTLTLVVAQSPKKEESDNSMSEKAATPPSPPQIFKENEEINETLKELEDDKPECIIPDYIEEERETDLMATLVATYSEKDSGECLPVFVEDTKTEIDSELQKIEESSPITTQSSPISLEDNDVQEDDDDLGMIVVNHVVSLRQPCNQEGDVKILNDVDTLNESDEILNSSTEDCDNVDKVEILDENEQHDSPLPTPENVYDQIKVSDEDASLDSKLEELDNKVYDTPLEIHVEIRNLVAPVDEILVGVALNSPQNIEEACSSDCDETAEALVITDNKPENTDVTEPIKSQETSIVVSCNENTSQLEEINNRNDGTELIKFEGTQVSSSVDTVNVDRIKVLNDNELHQFGENNTKNATETDNMIVDEQSHDEILADSGENELASKSTELLTEEPAEINKMSTLNDNISVDSNSKIDSNTKLQEISETTLNETDVETSKAQCVSINTNSSEFPIHKESVVNASKDLTEQEEHEEGELVDVSDDEDLLENDYVNVPIEFEFAKNDNEGDEGIDGNSSIELEETNNSQKITILLPKSPIKEELQQIPSPLQIVEACNIELCFQDQIGQNGNDTMSEQETKPTTEDSTITVPVLADTRANDEDYVTSTTTSPPEVPKSEDLSPVAIQPSLLLEDTNVENKVNLEAKHATSVQHNSDECQILNDETKLTKPEETQTSLPTDCEDINIVKVFNENDLHEPNLTVPDDRDGVPTAVDVEINVVKKIKIDELVNTVAMEPDNKTKESSVEKDDLFVDENVDVPNNIQKLSPSVSHQSDEVEFVAENLLQNTSAIQSPQNPKPVAIEFDENEDNTENEDKTENEELEEGELVIVTDDEDLMDRDDDTKNVPMEADSSTETECEHKKKTCKTCHHETEDVGSTVASETQTPPESPMRVQTSSPLLSRLQNVSETSDNEACFQDEASNQAQEASPEQDLDEPTQINLMMTSPASDNAIANSEHYATSNSPSDDSTDVEIIMQKVKDPSPDTTQPSLVMGDTMAENDDVEERYTKSPGSYHEGSNDGTELIKIEGTQVSSSVDTVNIDRIKVLNDNELHQFGENNAKNATETDKMIVDKQSHDEILADSGVNELASESKESLTEEPAEINKMSTLNDNISVDSNSKIDSNTKLQEISETTLNITDVETSKAQCVSINTNSSEFPIHQESVVNASKDLTEQEELEEGELVDVSDDEDLFENDYHNGPIAIEYTQNGTMDDVEISKTSKNETESSKFIKEGDVTVTTDIKVTSESSPKEDVQCAQTPSPPLEPMQAETETCDNELYLQSQVDLPISNSLVPNSLTPKCLVELPVSYSQVVDSPLVNSPASKSLLPDPPAINSLKATSPSSKNLSPDSTTPSAMSPVPLEVTAEAKPRRASVSSTNSDKPRDLPPEIADFILSVLDENDFNSDDYESISSESLSSCESGVEDTIKMCIKTLESSDSEVESSNNSEHDAENLPTSSITIPVKKALPMVPTSSLMSTGPLPTSSAMSKTSSTPVVSSSSPLLPVLSREKPDPISRSTFPTLSSQLIKLPVVTCPIVNAVHKPTASTSVCSLSGIPNPLARAPPKQQHASPVTKMPFGKLSKTVELVPERSSPPMVPKEEISSTAALSPKSVCVSKSELLRIPSPKLVLAGTLKDTSTRLKPSSSSDQKLPSISTEMPPILMHRNPIMSNHAESHIVITTKTPNYSLPAPLSKSKRKHHHSLSKNITIAKADSRTSQASVQPLSCDKVSYFQQTSDAKCRLITPDMPYSNTTISPASQSLENSGCEQTAAIIPKPANLETKTLEPSVGNLNPFKINSLNTETPALGLVQKLPSFSMLDFKKSNSPNIIKPRPLSPLLTCSSKDKFGLQSSIKSIPDGIQQQFLSIAGSTSKALPNLYPRVNGIVAFPATIEPTTTAASIVQDNVINTTIPLTAEDPIERIQNTTSYKRPREEYYDAAPTCAQYKLPQNTPPVPNMSNPHNASYDAVPTRVQFLLPQNTPVQNVSNPHHDVSSFSTDKNFQSTAAAYDPSLIYFVQHDGQQAVEGNYQLVYAAAAATAERDEGVMDGPPNKVRLLYAEALGVGSDSQNGNELQFYYTAAAPDQQVQHTSAPSQVQLMEPCRVTYSQITNEGRSEMLQYQVQSVEQQQQQQVLNLSVNNPVYYYNYGSTSTMPSSIPPTNSQSEQQLQQQQLYSSSSDHGQFTNTPIKLVMANQDAYSEVESSHHQQHNYRNYPVGSGEVQDLSSRHLELPVHTERGDQISFAHVYSSDPVQYNYLEKAREVQHVFPQGAFRHCLNTGDYSMCPPSMPNQTLPNVLIPGYSKNVPIAVTNVGNSMTSINSTDSAPDKSTATGNKRMSGLELLTEATERIKEMQTEASATERAAAAIAAVGELARLQRLESQSTGQPYPQTWHSHLSSSYDPAMLSQQGQVDPPSNNPSFPQNYLLQNPRDDQTCQENMANYPGQSTQTPHTSSDDVPRRTDQQAGIRRGPRKYYLSRTALHQD